MPAGFLHVAGRWHNVLIRGLVFVRLFVLPGRRSNSDDGWNFAVDCSKRTCPYDRAWADKPYAEDRAHSQAECSGAGLCDREAGSCTCFEGFTGSACQRSRCPNDCSLQGNCLTLTDIGLLEGNDYPARPVRVPAVASVWRGLGLGVEQASCCCGTDGASKSCRHCCGGGRDGTGHRG